MKERYLTFRRCRICGGVGNNKRKTEHNDNERRCLCFTSNPKTSLMLMIMMTLLTVVVNVLGDDTQALRDTLSSLCSLNKEGHFGSCCKSYGISSVTLASGPAGNCFIYSLSYTSGSITFLFVFQMYLRIIHFSGVLNRKD